MKRLMCARIHITFAALMIACTIAIASGMAVADERPAASGAPQAGKAQPGAQSAPAAKQSPAPGQVSAISLTPSVIMTRGLPGQSVTQTLTISNSTSTPFGFEMVAEDIVVRNGKREFVTAGELPHSIAGTAVFSKPTVLVQPGTSASVDVTVTLAPDTDIRAIVAIFRGTDKLKTDRTTVGMTASLGCLITFTASNNFQVTSADVVVHPQTETQPLKVSIELANAGTEPMIPEGVVALLSAAGKMVGKAPFASQRLLPGERLEFAAEYGAQLRPGRYKAVTSFQFEDKTLSKTAEFTVE